MKNRVTPREKSGRQQNAALREYPGELNFYHANKSGTGSAVRFELKPALGRREGFFFMVLAPQQTVTSHRSDGSRQMATFDWEGRLNIKLGLSDIGEMLLVLRNRRESINDGRGLFHDTAEANTVIQLRRGSEVSGYLLEVSRKVKRGGGEATRIRIVLSEAEGLLLRLLFEQSIILLVCGSAIYTAATQRGE